MWHEALLQLFLVGLVPAGKNEELDESMVSFVLRQYMRGENRAESLVGFFSNVVVQWRCGLACLFE